MSQEKRIIRPDSPFTERDLPQQPTQVVDRDSQFHRSLDDFFGLQEQLDLKEISKMAEELKERGLGIDRRERRLELREEELRRSLGVDFSGFRGFGRPPTPVDSNARSQISPISSRGGLPYNHELVVSEPVLQTGNEVRKPDLIAVKGEEAVVGGIGGICQPDAITNEVLYLCEFPECGRTSKTKTGHGVHQQKAHKARRRTLSTGSPVKLRPIIRDNSYYKSLQPLCQNLNNLNGSEIRYRMADLLREPLLVQKKEICYKSRKHIIEPQISNRKLKRIKNLLTQKLRKENKGKCIRSIIGSIKSTKTPPSKEIMVGFRKATMTSTNNASPGYDEPAKIHHSIWEPITMKEIESYYPPSGTSSGPDGITCKQLRDLNKNILLIILNIIIICDHPSDMLLKSRTTLIPKKEDAVEPGDFRPVTVSSVLLRCLHCILASRVNCTIPIGERQRAFRPVDGCSINIHLVDLQ
ncbi:hypothetical protein M0802_012718 [Mischocyttarus mexicanus]|nr:hypothetical protein M0802_012718 [Mischocyttarus mexicanus]